MTATLTRRYRFSASHRLASPQLSDEENRDTFGKCANPYGHGHNYVLEVSVRGPVDAVTGQVVAPAHLDGLVHDSVIRALDHRHLNSQVPEFAGELVPTTENLAVVVDRRLRTAWEQACPGGALQLHRVRLQETKNNRFELTH